MRRFLSLATVAIICAACGDQSVADPCMIRIDVIETTNIQVNASRNIEADVVVRSGVCSEAEQELSWSSSKPDVAQIVSFSNDGATITGRRAGSSTITAWLTRIPSVRDSIGVSIVAPTDN